MRVDLPKNNVNNSCQPTNSSDSSNNNGNKPRDSSNHNGEGGRKKKMIFKRSNVDLNHSAKRRNTKNIAKNFCKAFLSYLEEKQACKTAQEAKELMVEHNYNNKSIEKLASS